MPDSLDLLADHAARQARLEPAAALRRRADRRRTRRLAAGSTLAVVAVASIAVGVTGLGGDDRATDPMPATQGPSSEAPTSAPTSVQPQPLAAPTDAPRLDGTRQLVLLPVGTASVVSVAGSGDLVSLGDEVTTADVLSPRADLVPTPVSPGADSFALKTGGLQLGGEPLCLAAAPAGFVVAACDFGDDDMIWRLEPAGQTAGAASYALVTESGRPLDVGGDRFLVADTGRAQLPTLG